MFNDSGVDCYVRDVISKNNANKNVPSKPIQQKIHGKTV
jgi:hypothetical protein